MFFMILIHILNFVSIRFYLLFNSEAYFLCIILNYKNLKFKYMIDYIAIDFGSSEIFLTM